MWLNFEPYSQKSTPNGELFARIQPSHNLRIYMKPKIFGGVGNFCSCATGNGAAKKIKLAGDVAFANSLKSWHLSSLPISSGYHAYEWRSKHEPADIGEPAHLTALPQ
jgi:hypothetical protein